jgi:hypothetical protein
MFMVQTMTGPLVIEDIFIENTIKGAVIFEAKGAQPLVIKCVASYMGEGSVLREAGMGELYYVNASSMYFTLSGNAGVWARQLNTEGRGTRMKVKDSDVWILGMKTENNCTFIENLGGNIELLGGFCYPTISQAPTVPAFINNDGNLMISWEESASKQGYSEVVRNIHGGVTSSVGRDGWPVRTGQQGIMIPFYKSELKRPVTLTTP